MQLRYVLEFRATAHKRSRLDVKHEIRMWGGQSESDRWMRGVWVWRRQADLHTWWGMRHEPKLPGWTLTEEEKSEREMVRETGNRAKEAKG